MEVGFQRAPIVTESHTVAVSPGDEPGALPGPEGIAIDPHYPGEGAAVGLHVGRAIMGLAGDDVVGIPVEAGHPGIVPEH